MHTLFNAVLVFTLLIFPSVLLAQNNGDETKIRGAVENLFLAMHKGDSALARSVFSSQVTTATVFKAKTGETRLEQENSVEDFIVAIGKPHNDAWNEEIWNLTIQQDGDFAQVWCDYAFYIGDTFSHCGVDAFQLVKTENGWKIFHLADTRRSKDCVVPDDIRKKHE